MIAQQVYAVIVSHPAKGDMSPATISYTGGFYHIPIIGISSREAAFSDKVSETIEQLNAFRRNISIAEHPRILPANSGTVLPPSRRLGCSVATFSFLASDGHPQR